MIATRQTEAFATPFWSCPIEDLKPRSAELASELVGLRRPVTPTIHPNRGELVSDGDGIGVWARAASVSDAIAREVIATHLLPSARIGRDVEPLRYLAPFRPGSDPRTVVDQSPRHPRSVLSSLLVVGQAVATHASQRQLRMLNPGRPWPPGAAIDHLESIEVLDLLLFPPYVAIDLIEHEHGQTPSLAVLTEWVETF